MEQKTRYYYVDIVKFIAIICLFLAHVDTPKILKEIRGFDVVTMVILSGILAEKSYLSSENTFKYIIKRVKRLVIPTWIFLVGFYICMFLVGKLPRYEEIFKAFFFQRDSGIVGYVWIIWIYILCSFVVPIYVKIKNYIRIKDKFYIIIFIIVMYELICEYTNFSNSRVLYYTIFSIIPYGIITWIVMFYNELNNINKLKFNILMLSLHMFYLILLMKISREYVSLNSFKYPARFYYFSYGIFMGFILIEIFKKLDIKLKGNNIILFVSKYSLWIYLWHIFVLALMKYIFQLENWIIQFSFVFIFSLLFTFIQVKIILKIKKLYNFKQLNYFLC